MDLNINTLIAIIGEIMAIIGAVTPLAMKLKKITEGQKCQLRSDMLRIYYANREAETIRQYEYENFVMYYEAYKALKGNSFIDKIYNEVKKWEIVS